MLFSLQFFFFNDTATTEIYTLSLHDALPIFGLVAGQPLTAEVTAAAARDLGLERGSRVVATWKAAATRLVPRSEEHTSELQSRQYLVCRLLLEKKKPHMCYKQQLTDHEYKNQ